ncbi:transmembrane amino acid transporter protein-domain-containing protein [Zychaea mexicana]|uniref:transmembrane amino acid transporter protein-domain-containing protein n=1 Tax=Zychaea mexicana TaxID=64656 RepID=UPI0022FF2646|nr:transmembrane amino acid transporter protein-domain-containing protein [Zychaea mexicana]KAI9497581.1 transmembrane amino acid transporter protein-domain-containing protein [Zychaea mexicana]
MLQLCRRTISIENVSVPIPDETIANIVQQHLVTDSPHEPSSPDLGSPSNTSTSPTTVENSGRPTEEIPIPYYLPGTAITHDIYSHANSLLSNGSPLQRSKSSNDIRFKAGKVVHSDDEDVDPVMENLDKPGGFRRFHMQQQRMLANINDADGSVRSASNHSDAAATPLFRPASSASTVDTTDYSGLFQSDSLRSNTIHSMRGVPTRHFLEYLAITSVLDHFAGENLSDSEDDEYTSDSEEAPLLQQQILRRRQPWRYQQLANNKRHQRNQVTDVEDSRPKHKASIMKTVLLLFKAFISSGILFLPKGFSNGGLGFSIAVLYFMGVVSLYCFLLLLDCKQHYSGSYGDIGGALYGPWMRRIVLFSIGISQNVIQAVRSLSHYTIELSNSSVLVMVAVLLAPMVLIRNIAKLSPAALFADVLIVSGLLILLACDIYQIFYGTGGGPTPGPGVQWWFNPSAYPVFIGTAVYSFEGIGLIIPIRDAMEKPEKFPMVLTLVMILVATALCSVGSLGYVAFGTDVKTVALLNLPDGPLGSTVQLGYALAVHMTNPLALFPTVRIVEHALFGERTGKHNLHIKWQKNCLRFAIVVTCGVIAWAGANDLDKFISLIGSICCCPLSLIFPPLFHLSLDKTRGFQRVMDMILITFGVGVMVFTLYNTSKEWGSSK